MPLYYFRCEGGCQPETRRVLSPAQAASPQLCDCGSPLRRAPRGASATVIERLDNGFMAKAVERPADAERLYRERADADNKKTE